MLLRVVCGPSRSRRKADGQVQEHLPIQTIIGRAMVLVTMRSSGEVQPQGAVHGAGIDPARALLRRHRFRSKASWHGERHWQPAANWIPQPRSARIHWMGVSGAFKESTDWAVSSKSRWLASSGGTVRPRAVEGGRRGAASVDPIDDRCGLNLCTSWQGVEIDDPNRRRFRRNRRFFSESSTIDVDLP